MPPADNTPDFDSMSPEELMAWMETLAERQGASEGFTTDKRMDIAEVDPTAVEDTGPGYIPYGMTEEQWAKKQADEAAAKAQRAASAPPPAPQPVVAIPEPAAPAPAPEPQPAAAQAATPDFDSMSPEELMAWMETLAERQGAEIGFTTDKRMNIAEIDPATVEDTGPGYIPYGMTEEQWAKKQAAEAAAKAQRAASPSPAAPAPQPVAPTPEPEPVAAEMPDFSLPQFDAEPEMTTELTTPAGGDEAGSGLAWLESLAADQGGDFPQMDLSSLGEEIAPLDLDSLAEAVTPTADVTDPMQWLENLAQTQEEPFAQPVQDELASAPSEASDPLEWLESLAKRQGADPEEFTTRADLDIPVPSAPQPAAPGYTDYVFDEDTVGPAIDMPVNVDELDKIDESDPVAWLESLASQQAFETPHAGATSDEDVSEEEIIQDAIQSDIMAALSGGENVSADAMKDWMDTLLEQGATRSDEIEDLEEDEEIELEAQIPDWLVEQVGPPPDMMQQPSVVPSVEPEDEPLLAEVFGEQTEPEAAAGIPDWLRDEGQDESLSELESIFAAPTAQPAAPPEPEPHTVAAVVSRASDDIEIDPNDPWVEAFELERQQHLQGKDITELLDEVVLDVAAPAVGSVEALQPASFAPESELVPGEAQDVPDWLAEALPDGGAPAQPAFMSDDMDEAVAEGEMPSWLLKQIGMETETELAVVSELDDDLPDWLKEAGVAKTDTVPDWLIETVETGPEEPVFVAPPAPVAPTPAPAAPPPAIVPVVASPAPVHQAALDPAAAAAALDAARTKVGGGDVQGAILEYEAVVRANTHLDAVIKDLADMVKGAHKHNAAVYRVLGDSLMRHGRLQEALDTYRKALNLL